MARKRPKRGKKAGVQAFHPLAALAPCLNHVGTFHCDPGKTYPLQTNRDYDFHFVLSGRGTVNFGGKAYPKRAGDLLLYRPGVSVQETAARDDPQRFIYAHFDACWVPRLPGDRPTRGPRSPRIGIDVPVRTPGPAPRRISECFEGLVTCRQMADGTARILRARSLILEILAYLHDRARFGHPAGDIPARDRSRVQRVLNEMEERLAEPLPLDDLAAVVDLSPVYFSGIFRRVVGEPPKAHLLRLRLDAARDLLRQTTLPVKQIAERTGFRGIHYFSRIFRKHVGLPPRQYRDEGEII